VGRGGRALADASAIDRLNVEVLLMMNWSSPWERKADEPDAEKLILLNL
jgi:hypothetical protein